MHWKTCNHAVYANPKTGALSEDDPSVPSALSVLPNVIEKSERVVIVHGLAVRHGSLLWSKGVSFPDNGLRRTSSF